VARGCQLVLPEDLGRSARRECGVVFANDDARFTSPRKRGEVKNAESARLFENRILRNRRPHAGFARYPARNILVALSTTSVIRSAEGAGAAWKMNGMNGT